MRAYRGHWKGKNFVSKIYCYCPWFLKRWILFSLSNLRAEYNWRAISRTLPSNLKLPLISEEIFNLSNLRVLPAKSKCKMPSDFWWKIQVFFPLINIFFSFFKKDQKLFLKEAKLFFFIRNLRAFCIYFLQVLPAKSISWCHLILMKKCPWIMINFALWKWWHLW